MGGLTNLSQNYRLKRSKVYVPFRGEWGYYVLSMTSTEIKINVSVPSRGDWGFLLVSDEREGITRCVSVPSRGG